MKQERTIAIVPVKSLAGAKTRLSRVLTAAARRRLTLAMLADVLGTLGEVAAIDGILVVTPDGTVAQAVREQEASVLLEPEPSDLNRAISQAAVAAQAQGASRTLIIPGDVPLVTAAEICGMVADARAAIAPSQDGAGTNALLLQLPLPFRPSFGPQSFERHARLATAAKVDCRTIRRPGLGFDVDQPADLTRLALEPRYAWLAGEIRPSQDPAILEAANCEVACR